MKLIHQAERNNGIKHRATDEMSVYKQVYDIGTISENKIISKEFFDYCKSKRNFILIVLYDDEGKVYLKENGVDSFGLPGGEIFETETIMNAVQRILANLSPKLTISELEPLTLVENIFLYEDESVKHEGIIMLARSNPNQDDAISARYYSINESIMARVNMFANSNILEMYCKRRAEILRQTNGDFQDKEIETNQKYKLRYKFHNDFVKRFLLTPKVKKTKKLKQIMAKKCEGCKKLIDISCGDNSLLFSLIDDSMEFVIANDICWSQIELIPEKDKIFFTNHNAIVFPFKENAFDFVYCSNTLHHIPNHENLVNLLDSLLKIGKKVVIYEIEDPKVTGGLPYILNKYWYRGFLKDVGEQYLSSQQFIDVILKAYKGKANIKFSRFKNIQGSYMIADIEKKIS